MYIIPILHGIWQGFLISILLFGPAFFKLVHISIQEGFRKGVLLAWGVFLSDLLVVALCIFGFADFMQSLPFQKMYSLCGAIVLFLLGIKAFNHQYKAFLQSYSARVPASKGILKGFLLNLANPFTFILWFNVLGTVSLKYVDESKYTWLVSINLMTILIIIFLMDVLKVYLSHLIGKKLNVRLFFTINKYFGLLLIIIGAIFLFRFAKLMGWIQV
ncbi:MAG: LysE family transporter [Bacteroidetes bacterium]|nr:LysE family transporter [Bacteroidota bacterium]